MPQPVPHSAAPLAQSARLALRLPALLLEAQQLAAGLHLGEHGRRRAGAGDEFWQYRHVQAGDSATLIDWRRSGRGDEYFTRQTEWQAAQTLLIWSDPAASMRYASSADPMAQKRNRADVIALALIELALRAGERAGWLDAAQPPRRGVLQREGLATLLLADRTAQPLMAQPIPKGAKVVILSDFLENKAALGDILTAATAAGASGAVLHLVDPSEAAFPFAGRILFEARDRETDFETQSAEALRAEYQTHFAAHRASLMVVAQKHGWPFISHHTDRPASEALMLLYHALSEMQR
ncbi:DUF58 domain-containing protein [Rhodobacteraceae bacterium XHP0102]|nr:DUF58 domain-containing protein [Rhodobacteraceae bacterium XHP0102]